MMISISEIFTILTALQTAYFLSFQTYFTFTVKSINGTFLLRVTLRHYVTKTVVTRQFHIFPTLHYPHAYIRDLLYDIYLDIAPQEDIIASLDSYVNPYKPRIKKVRFNGNVTVHHFDCNEKISQSSSSQVEDSPSHKLTNVSLHTYIPRTRLYSPLLERRYPLQNVLRKAFKAPFDPRQPH